jgi:hypothetical protein
MLRASSPLHFFFQDRLSQQERGQSEIGKYGCTRFMEASRRANWSRTGHTPHEYMHRHLFSDGALIVTLIVSATGRTCAISTIAILVLLPALATSLSASGRRSHFLPHDYVLALCEASILHCAKQALCIARIRAPLLLIRAREI